MTTQPDCIVLKQIHHHFGNKPVLTDIDLSVPYGSIYGILGPSGCGKTTTVKIMAGILEAASGSVYVLGESMPQLKLMNRIGYMAQSDALYTLLTAGENLEFFGSLYGISKKKIQAKTAEILQLVNLSEHQDKPVMAYSGGMKRRLSLAAALIHEPEVLILDEPTVGIDPLLRKSIWEALYSMVEQGMTIIVTTHVMDEADKCHQLAMMRDGKLIAAGSPRELQQKAGAKNLEEAFIFYGGGENRED